MKKDKFILILVGMSIVFVYVVLRLVQENNKIRNELPYFMYGERISKFDLVGMDNKTVDLSSLKNATNPSLIFIFTTPCSPCNKNIVYWSKLAEILQDKVSIYGIVLDDISQASSFSESSKLNFGIFVPVRLDEFKKSMRLKLNIEQTILCDKNKVEFVFLGVLEMNDLSRILDNINKIRRP